MTIVSALFFNGNFSRTRLILKHDGYIPNRISESRLNRRLHEIDISKAKKKFYYGFKIHRMTTCDGKPVEFIITPASTADITAFKLME